MHKTGTGEKTYFFKKKKKQKKKKDILYQVIQGNFECAYCIDM